MSKTILTQEDINQIINLYQTTIPSTHKLAEQFKVGHKKISKLLKDNNVKINLKGAQIKFGNSSEIEKSKTVIYSTNNENKKLIAVCKKTNLEFEDVNNLSGCLTRHMIETYGEFTKIPNNTYQRKKYELENGKKWFEEYFNIIEVLKKKVRKCKLCEWETIDTCNKTGCFEQHIKTHSIELKDYLIQFPEDKIYHKIFVKNENYTNTLKIPSNAIKCQICSETMKVINNTHLMDKHKITPKEYKLMFPNHHLLSKTTYDLFSLNYKNANLTMKPTWTSKGEIELKEFIESLGFEVEKSRNRALLQGREIDIIIPKLNIGFEFNGLYYHTEKMGKYSTYHINKTIACNEVGYKLIHIFEDEWVVKKDLVKNKIKHILNVNNGVKIGARKCNIIKISSKIKSNFLNNNHIQNSCSSLINYGAYYENELIGVMCFGDKRYMTKDDGSYELLRFATKQKYVVSGLASKLLKVFINEYKPQNIISFADRRWTLNANNNLYTNLGFKLTNITKPTYCYYNSKIDKYKRLHKFGFGKNSLKKKYPNLDFSKTEKEIMDELGYDRIWDCGLFKYELNFNK